MLLIARIVSRIGVDKSLFCHLLKDLIWEFYTLNINLIALEIIHCEIHQYVPFIHGAYFIYGFGCVVIVNNPKIFI